MTSQFKESTKNNGLKQVVWGSEEFVAKTLEIKDEYIRPVDQKMDLHKLSECDPMMVRPLLDTGLWVRATEDEVREWIRLAKNDSEAI